MKNITFQTSFSPTDAPDSITYDNGMSFLATLFIVSLLTSLLTVFTFEAGVQWFEAYNAAQQHNRVIVGGISQRGSVGAVGGWLQGGGHSILSPNYGLGMFSSVHLTMSYTYFLYRCRQRIGNKNRNCRWFSPHCESLPQFRPLLGSPWRRRWNLGSRDFRNLQNPPVHHILCRLPQPHFDQPHLNTQPPHSTHPAHSLFHPKRIWRIWRNIQ